MPFTPGNTVNMSVNQTMSTVTLPGPLPTPGGTGWTDVLIIQNVGSKEAFIAIGSSSVSAAVPSSTAAAGFPIQANLAIEYSFKITSQTTLAAICGGTDTTTLRLTNGTGTTAV